MIFWGVTRKGKQRFRCKKCLVTGIKKRSDRRIKNREVLFERWLLKTETLERLAHERKTKSSALVKSFVKFWNIQINPLPYNGNSGVLLVDGIILERGSCILIAIDGNGIPIVWYECIRENTSSWEALFELVNKQRMIPSVIVSDGQKGLIKSIHSSFGTIPHQRCMTHVVRLGHAWLTRNPMTLAGQELRLLVSDLYEVKTKSDMRGWNIKFNGWNVRYYNFLKEKS